MSEEENSLSEPSESLTNDGVKTLDIFVIFSFLVSLLTSFPTSAPLWYTCLGNFISSMTLQNLVWNNPLVKLNQSSDILQHS